MNSTTEKTIELLKSLQPGQGVIEKAINVGLGLTWYDLEPVAKQLYPVITPVRNMIPRVKGDGGTATNWKAVTGINTAATSPVVGEGNRGAVVTTSTASYAASYKGLGLEDYVTFEADYAAMNFDDVRALAVQNLLRAMFIQEEYMLLFGNASLALGTPATPTTATATTGGTIAAATYNVIVVALTLAGYQSAVVGAAGVPGAISKTNADSTSDAFGGGSSNKSTAASQVTTGATSTLSASVAAVKGAVAYAWYVGTAGNEKIAAITTINSMLITALPAGGNQNASAITADNSTNALGFDGFYTQALAGTGLWQTNATGTLGTGTGLTTDNAGGIVEIDADLKSFWDNYRLGPQYMFVNSQELLNITKKVIAAGGTPLFRFVVDNGGNQNVNNLTIAAGAVIGTYLNKFTMAGGELVKVILHPNVPPGTILYYSNTLPYPLSNVRNIIQVKTRKEYYQIEWPLKTRKYEYGVYLDSLLQLYAPFAFGARQNVANA